MKMSTLDPSLEAFVFQYVSFGVFTVVNNVWTWIAVVTAAVSFWRIRVNTIEGSHRLLEELTGSKSEDKCDLIGPESIIGLMEESTVRVKETAMKTKPLMYDDGVTKGKMTMYYGVDVDGERYVDGELTAVNNGGVELSNCGEWWEKWERVVKMRNGDDSWYRYVDLMVINGNVVRLWDDQ